MSNYAIADLHGRYDLFQQIKNFIQPEDKVYVIGDCGDRGPDGWKIIKEVYNNPQFFFIKGNHEDMLADAMRGNYLNCFYNGGKSTFEAWVADGEDSSWYKKLKNLPDEMVYVRSDLSIVILCHAGYTPHKSEHVYPEDKIWDRTHFNQIWDMDYQDTYMIHGHTGCPMMFHYLYEQFPMNYNFKDPEIITYADGHKIDIDLASAYTGKAALLNLDNFDIKYFYGEELYKNYLKELSKFNKREIEYWE